MAATAQIRTAVAQTDEHARLARASALLAERRFADAEALCRDGPNASDPLLRIRGYILQELGRDREAAGCYERVVRHCPGDFESWNNLGNARRQVGDVGGAIDALEHARALRPNLAPIEFNLGAAYAAAGLLEKARAALQIAARLSPDSVAPWLELSRVLARLRRTVEALDALYAALRLAPTSAELHIEASFLAAELGELETGECHCREAVRLAPGNVAAISSLGTFLESSNRMEELAALLATVDARRTNDGALAFLRAHLLRHAGRLEEAAVVAETIPDQPHPDRKRQLIGELADRLGQHERAFSAFSEMNRLAAAERPDARATAACYRKDVAKVADVTTASWFRSWPEPAPPAGPPAPVFLVGFPRSGTTLLDTILAGHPQLRVIEERPVLQPVFNMLGGDERLPMLSADEIAALRARYFQEVQRFAPDALAHTIIDKMPLNIRQIPLLHRLFPDARWIFAERHPCDVVLSCFITRFRLNSAMANFLDLKDTATLYDQILGYWHQCRAIFPLRVHTVRYEAMVQDLENSVRPLFAFLGLEWNDGVLDHARTAKNRRYIRTASYAQVAEPIYHRAVGRWSRYRSELSPVMPILEPWAARMGYDT